MSYITDIVRSQDMREYLSSLEQKGELSNTNKAAIIYHSFIPIEKKIELLSRLYDECNDNIILIIKDALEKSLDYLYNKDNNAYIYIIDWEHLPLDEEINFDNYHYVDFNTYGTYNSFEEFKTTVCKEDYGVCFNINIIEVFSDKPNRDIISFIGAFIDDKFEILYPDLSRFGHEYFNDMIFNNLDKETDHSINYIIDSTSRHYDIIFPYRKDELVKFQSYLMSEPLYGYLISEYDGNHTPYCFFCDEDGNTSEDFAFHEIGFENCVSCYDWLSRASEEEIKQYKKKIELKHSMRTIEGINNTFDKLICSNSRFSRDLWSEGTEETKESIINEIDSSLKTIRNNMISLLKEVNNE